MMFLFNCMIKSFHNFLPLIVESVAKRKYSDIQIQNSKKITEYCEEYVLDILDDCMKRGIRVSSYTIPSGNDKFEWNLTINEYYPINIDNLIKKLSLEFEVNNWWIESSGTSSPLSKLEKKTKLTLSIIPKIELFLIIFHV